MKKIAQGIVRLRKLILTVAFLLLIPSAIGAIATRINYDILTYLPQDLDSMIGEVALEDDFHLASTGMITVEGLPTNELIAMKKDIEAVPGVTQTFWLSDVIDPSIPTEMLPADVQQFMFGKNDSTMLIVRFDAFFRYLQKFPLKICFARSDKKQIEYRREYYYRHDRLQAF